jgi:hypothetical protein
MGGPVSEQVWAAWNALDQKRETSPVKQIAATLDLPTHMVARIVYPPADFNEWDDSQELALDDPVRLRVLAGEGWLCLHCARFMTASEWATDGNQDVCGACGGDGELLDEYEHPDSLARDVWAYRRADDLCDTYDCDITIERGAVTMWSCELRMTITNPQNEPSRSTAFYTGGGNSPGQALARVILDFDRYLDDGGQEPMGIPKWMRGEVEPA